MSSKHISASLIAFIAHHGYQCFKQNDSVPTVIANASFRKHFEESNTRLIQMCEKDSKVYKQTHNSLYQLFSSQRTISTNNTTTNTSERTSRMTALISAVIIIGWMQAIVEQHNVSGDALFQGAHVVVDDPDGRFLERIKSSCEHNGMSIINRFSSHYKNEKLNDLILDGNSPSEAERLFNQGKPDYSVRAEGFIPELCLGQFKRDKKQFTWLQLEAHSHQERTFYTNWLSYFLNSAVKFTAHKMGFEYSQERLLHDVKDFFFIYLLFYRKQRNVGPFGTSPRTENHSPIEIGPVIIPEVVVSFNNNEASMPRP